MKFEDLVVNYLGEFGRYQKIQFFLVCLPSMFAAMHALSWTFTAANSPHRCRLPGEDPASASYWLPVGNTRIPIEQCDLKAHPDWDRCQYKSCEFSNGTRCSEFIYDRSEIKYSALHRWDIVCDRGILKAIIQSTYYIGQMIGSLVFGYLGDRIGRKKVFFIAIILQIVCGFGMVVSPSWILFGILRAGTGFAHPGIFVIAVVIGVELVGPSKRKIASIFTGIFFSLGQMTLGLLAYHIRDYRYLQLAIAAPALVFLSYWWLVPESARWLFSQQRYEEADKVLRRAARFNKSTLPEKWWEDIDESEAKAAAAAAGKPLSTANTASADPSAVAAASSNGSQTEPTKRRTYGFLDLLRTPKMRRRSLAIFLCWPIVSMVYYGVSMNTNFLGGDLYKTFIFGALMEIPAVLAVFFLIDIIGRKALLAGGFTIASVCLLSNLFIGADAHWAISMAQFLLAKGSITGTYAGIYTFTPELFPTVIRNTAMGCSSMAARVGAILASYIAMWLVDEFGKIAMIIPFASLGLCAALIIVFLLPETKGKHLSETIEEVEGQAQQFELQPLTSPNPANKTE